MDLSTLSKKYFQERSVELQIPPRQAGRGRLSLPRHAGRARRDDKGEGGVSIGYRSTARRDRLQGSQVSNARPGAPFDVLPGTRRLVRMIYGWGGASIWLLILAGKTAGPSTSLRSGRDDTLFARKMPKTARGMDLNSPTELSSRATDLPVASHRQVKRGMNREKRY